MRKLSALGVLICVFAAAATVAPLRQGLAQANRRPTTRPANKTRPAATRPADARSARPAATRPDERSSTPASQPDAEPVEIKVSTTAPDELSPAERLREYLTLGRQVGRALEAKQYGPVEPAARRMIALVDREASGHLNLARALANQGRPDEAVAAVGEAIRRGYAETAGLRRDEHLASLRKDKAFVALLDKAWADQKKQAARFYEKAPALKGVRTVEGFPESGLRWRLHLSPKATADRPNRLVIWLHPSGGSLNATVEKMAPMFIERGYALLVISGKDWSGWTSAQSRQLTEYTLADVAKTPGLDADKPILFGYSAGGQLALFLWAQSPQKWAGLVLDAAYPVLPRVGTQPRIQLIVPPKSDAVAACPMFVLLGDQDRGAQVWIRVEDAWRSRGVPLTIHYVAGQGHTWLFGGAQREKLGRWLDDVSAGRRPGSPTTQPDAASSKPARPVKIEEVY